MKVEVTALGAVRKYLPETRNIEISDRDLDLRGLITDHLGIPPTMSRIGYVVNGRLQKSNYLVRPGDKIKILIMGSAG